MSFLTEFPELKTIIGLARERKCDVHLVGGFLRDHLLGRPCSDFDFAVEKGATEMARILSRKIRGAFVLLDKERGCARVVKKKNSGIQTFDFADYRAGTFSEDLSHRDFTINTLAVYLNDLTDTDSLPGILIDEKKGKRDLRAATIKMTSTRAFREDPLRLLRAFSLKAVLGFHIDKKTLDRIKKDRALLRGVSYERIREEFFKILSADQAAGNLKALDKIGLLEEVLPQVAVMHHVQQGAYHHLDVWRHSLETVAQLEKVFEEFRGQGEISGYLDEEISGQHMRRELLLLAALLHDIGKPETKKKEKGKMSFHGHERVGKNIVRSAAKLVKLSTKERHFLEDVVFWHLRPGYLSNFSEPSARAVFRYFCDTGEEGASILLLSLADQRATRGPMTTRKDLRHHEKICLHLLKLFFEKKKEKPFIRLINGDDLIHKLKLKPSVLFSRILTEVEEKQVLGRIKNKAEALALAKRIAEENED
ncbi:MAG: HDIG domain-containing metalloprotein [Candidatus Omnitrophota bacterium]